MIFTCISLWPEDDSLSTHASGSLPGGPSTKAHAFVLNALGESIQNCSGSFSALKLLLPAVSGHVVRNDIVARRLLTCQLAAKTADFTTPRERVSEAEFPSNGSIVETAMRNAIGAISLKTVPGTDLSLVKCSLASLEADISARLSFPFILHQPLCRQRLAMVFGRPNPATSTASQGIYRASRALGIGLVILDEQGHWAQASNMAGFREEFIECDLTLDSSLPSRIVEALSRSQGGPVDGIVTFTDTHLLPTAQAAALLGLSASPVGALECCRDKAKMRKAVSAEIALLATTGLDDLKRKLAAADGPWAGIQYPQIVKPSVGCSSEGVTKVQDQEQLLQAVQRNELKFPGVGLQIEPYVSGPEVDVNLVLLDGTLVWSEINDDFPSSADLMTHEKDSNTTTPWTRSSFAEVSTIMPSALPQAEIDLATQSLKDTLLKLGFRNGMFHLEARIKNSRKQYTITPKGVKLLDCGGDVDKLELEHGGHRQVEALSTPVEDPSVFLIEINARLPGHQEDFAVEYTYGIDYFAVTMLMALLPAAGSISSPAHLAVLGALTTPLPPQYRYPSNIVFIPAEKGGVFQTRRQGKAGSPPLPEMLAREFVKEYALFVQEGDLVLDPSSEGKWPFLAFFLVVATMVGAEGREQARSVGELVRQSFDYCMS